MPKRGLVFTSALVALVLGVTACSDNSDSADEASTDQGQTDSAAAEPDLEGIPDVVAEVDGVELTGDDFSQVYEANFAQMSMQAQMSGEEVDQDQLKQQTLDSLINNQLLINEGENRGIEASDEDINAVLEAEAQRSQLGSADALIEAVEEQGGSEDQLREDAAHQFAIDGISADLDIPEPSEEELRETYDEFASAQSGATEGADDDSSAPAVPEFDELRDQIATQLQAEREQTALLEYAESLREEAEIQTHLEVG